MPSSDTSRCRSRSRRHGCPGRPPAGPRMASRKQQAHRQQPRAVVQHMEGTDLILIDGTWRTLELCSRCHSASVKGGGEHSWCLNPRCLRSKAMKEADWAPGGKKRLRKEKNKGSNKQATTPIIQIHMNPAVALEERQDAASSLGPSAVEQLGAEGAGTLDNLVQTVLDTWDNLQTAPGNASSVEPLAKRMPQRIQCIQKHQAAVRTPDGSLQAAAPSRNYI